MSKHLIRRVKQLHREAIIEGYNQGIRVLSYDPAAAAARPGAFRAFQERVKDACPGIGDRLFLEPVRPGWELHWPTGDDDAAIDVIVQQDDMLALLDMLEAGDEQPTNEVNR